MARSCVGRRLLHTWNHGVIPPTRWPRRAGALCVACTNATTTGGIGAKKTNYSSARGPLASVLASRRALQLQVPPQQFPIVGVSFDNRQDSVKQLRPGQGLLFVREPDNPHDPDAVAVHTTAGTPLGYVSRGLTHHFRHERVPGHVRGVTLNSEGLHGARVLVRPSLPGVLLQQLPASLWARGCAELDALPGADGAARLRHGALEAAGFRCEVTGLAADAGAGLQVTPVWRLDVNRRVAVLVRCLAVCDAVYRAERLLDPARGRVNLGGEGDGVAVADDVRFAAELVQDVNFWRMQDIWQYFQHCQAVQELLSAEGPEWRYELGDG